MTVLDKLLEHSAKTESLKQVVKLLHWDQETMMPSGSVEQRANWLAVMEGMIHDRDSAPELSEWLDRIKENNLPDPDRAIVAKVRRSNTRAIAVPSDLPPRIARTVVRAISIWREAREKDDVASYLPILSELVELKRVEADALSSGADRYDALLDEFEPAMTSARLDEVFARLRPGLSNLRERVFGSATFSVHRMDGMFPAQAQLELARSLATAFDYDFERGRLDLSAHPFASGVGDDVRITTRIDDRDPYQCMYSTIHEVGHAIYEQNVAAELRGTIIGHGASCAVHESQSRILENQIGRSRAFTAWIYNELRGSFGGFGINSAEAFFADVNAVGKNFIRTDADEIQYNLHVMLRYDLERQLIGGGLEVSDLEEAWNERFRSDFGFAVEKPSDGLLQDIHWAGGSFGYFPTYTLGNIYAGCLYAAICKDHPDLEAQLESGNAQPVTDWLKEKVQKFGSLHPPVETIERATGFEISERYLLDYLERKFGDIYSL